MRLKAGGLIPVPAPAHTPGLAFWHPPPNSAGIGSTTERALLNQPVFYFMSVHIEVILDNNKTKQEILLILIFPQDCE